jgi:hypothetical protein
MAKRQHRFVVKAETKICEHKYLTLQQIHLFYNQRMHSIYTHNFTHKTNNLIILYPSYNFLFYHSSGFTDTKTESSPFILKHTV